MALKTTMEAEAGSLQMVGMQATLSYRVNTSIPYLIGAARYSRMVREIETANASAAFGEFWEEMRDHATSCIFFADASIESYANEIFADAPKVFPAEFIAGLDVLLGELERRKGSLAKLDIALSLRNKPKLDRKSAALKAVNALGRLRNELTHFKPEWSHELKQQVTVSEQLKGYFPPSVWINNEQLFPRAWVGHAATRWAVETAVSFLMEFEKLADLPDRTNWSAFDARLSHQLNPLLGCRAARSR
jgi:hypothetical protein